MTASHNSDPSASDSAVTATHASSDAYGAQLELFSAPEQNEPHSGAAQSASLDDQSGVAAAEQPHSPSDSTGVPADTPSPSADVCTAADTPLTRLTISPAVRDTLGQNRSRSSKARRAEPHSAFPSARTLYRDLVGAMRRDVLGQDDALARCAILGVREAAPKKKKRPTVRSWPPQISHFYQ
jgi:hypothetical protein